MPRHLLSFGAALALSACTGLVPTTLLDLGRLDPLKADPAQLAVGIETTSGVAPVRESAVLTFTATHSPRGDVRRIDVPLIEDRSQEIMVIYTLSPDNAESLRRYQREIAGWKDSSDGKSTLALDVTAKGCRRPGVTLGPDPRVSVHVRLAIDAALRPLLRDAPALPFFEAQTPQDLPVCAGFH